MGKMGKKSNKRKHSELEIMPKEEVVKLADVRISDEPIPKKVKWINKQRVLILAARGISHRDRHFMSDLKTLMPHHRAEPKMERAKTLAVINEMCEMKHCNKAMLLEGRRKRDLYMWLSSVPSGPSAKFLLENVHTMGELKMTGNCLKGSRPFLSFDKTFDEEPHLKLLKELFTQIFGVPNYHPKSQPFIDHVYTFTYIDKRIWFRNYQILSEDGGLAEMGPRFVMNPIKIFNDSFTGEPLWENKDYISPARYRQTLRKNTTDRYISKMEKKIKYEANRPMESYKLTELNDVFGGDPLVKAKQFLENEKLQLESEEKQKNNVTIQKEDTTMETTNSSDKTKSVTLKKSGKKLLKNKKSKKQQKMA